MWINDLKVEVLGFSYAWNRKSNKFSVSMHGNIMRPGVVCRFNMSSRGQKHHLDFPHAFIHDGSDPYDIALSVKRALLEFIRNTNEIAEPHREQLLTCVLKHHEQVKK